MPELNKLNARIYSRLGQRGAIFGMAALDAAEANPDFVVLTADLATLSGLDRYVKTYPGQFINVGIAEQNMLGMAAGLAAEGFLPVATTYATFITMRSCEQLRHFFGYMNLKGVIIGSGAGLCQGFAGNTHYTIEDISVVRAIPNITILSPADAGSAVKLFEIACQSENAVYMRLTGNLNCPVVYTEDTHFQIGGYNRIRQGADISIYATGTVVTHALKAAEIMANSGVEASVYDIYSIKPLNHAVIADAGKAKLCVTIEEHNTIGGLGAAIAEILSQEGNMPPLLRLGIHDEFDLAGSYEGLLKQNRLMPEQLAEDILTHLSK